jgi:hypothetical protein
VPYTYEQQTLPTEAPRIQTNLAPKATQSSPTTSHHHHKQGHPPRLTRPLVKHRSLLPWEQCSQHWWSSREETACTLHHARLDVCRRMLTYADVCWRYASDRMYDSLRMLTYAGGMQVTACTIHYVRLERHADITPVDIRNLLTLRR